MAWIKSWTTLFAFISYFPWLAEGPLQIQALSETNMALKVGENMQLNTSVMTYVYNITNCNLTRVDSNETMHCSSIEVTGSPPDLTVSARLNNVTEHDQGTWRLTLTNHAGDGHLNFRINVIGADADNGKLLPTIVSLIPVSFFIVAAVVGITMYLLCCQKNARKADEAHEGSEENVMLRQESNDISSQSNDTMTIGGLGIPSGSGRGSQQMARQASPPGADSAERHDYEEIPDNLIVEHIPLVTVRPARHCRAPRGTPLPDGYLHPSPSLPERINTSHGASTSDHLQPTSDNAQTTSDDTQCTWGTEWETISDNNQQIASDNTHPTLDYTQSTLFNTQSTKDNTQSTRDNTQSTSSITQSTPDYTGAMSAYTEATPDNTKAMSVYTAATPDYTAAMSVYTEATPEYTEAMSVYTKAKSDYTEAISVYTKAASNDTQPTRVSTQFTSVNTRATSEYTQLTLETMSATSEYTQLKLDI